MLKIPYAKVSCNGNELRYLQEVLESGWLTTAGKAQHFETLFAQKTGARFACAVNSCTAALHLGLDALGVAPGDKVFVPAMTFTATAEVVRYMGADPVCLDVEYGSSLLTPALLKEAIERYPEVKVLIVVHFGGQAAEMLNARQEGILDLCRQNGIRVMEDAAHAFPASLNGEMVGSMGDVTCFSFYANKTITTGEGGMLTTNDKEIYERVKLMRLHGINRDVWDRFTSEKPSWEYDVVAPGFKYNMPDVNAAIGLAQLERVEELRAGRQAVAEFYLSGLKDCSWIDLPRLQVAPEEHAWHLFPLILNEESAVNRNEFIAEMARAGIGTSVHYKPIYRLQYYRERYGLRPEDYPNAERTWQGTVSLPIYPGLSAKDLSYVVQCIQNIQARKPVAVFP